MNILIITEEPFPVGWAATNRILSLSKSFVENGARVKVICLRPQEEPEKGIANKDAKGSVGSVEYEYASGTTIRGGSFLKRRWLRAAGLVRTISIVKNISDRSPSDTLLLYNQRSLIFVLFFYFLSRACRYLMVCDVEEHPLVYLRNSLLLGLYDRLSFNVSYKLYDAVLVITNHLEREFAGRVRRGVPLLNVPMTVEAERFMNSASRKPGPSDYIAYCGDVRGVKDGVTELIKSFELISKKYDDLKLYIIGDAPGTDALARLKEFSRSLGVDGKIVFTGRVLRDDMPGYLCHARILALARPTSMQADYGFPSKLGEYLATGNPVVVTRTGEIPLYLEDGKNAFLTDPDNIEQFAAKLEYVLENPDIARQVGLRGRAVALENFEYKLQGERIIRFLNQRASQL